MKYFVEIGGDKFPAYPRFCELLKVEKKMRKMETRSLGKRIWAARKTASWKDSTTEQKMQMIELFKNEPFVGNADFWIYFVWRILGKEGRKIMKSKRRIKRLILQDEFQKIHELFNNFLYQTKENQAQNEKK